jgi:hypothetical protein
LAMLRIPGRHSQVTPCNLQQWNLQTGFAVYEGLAGA